MNHFFLHHVHATYSFILDIIIKTSEFLVHETMRLIVLTIIITYEVIEFPTLSTT